MLRKQNRLFTGTFCMLIQEAGEPHVDHMAPINIDSNYCSSITLKPYYSLHVSHKTRDSGRNQLWILNGLGSNLTRWGAMPMKCTNNFVLYMCVRLNSRMRARQSMIRRRKCSYYSVHINRQLSCPAGYLRSNFPNMYLTCSQFIISSDIYCRSLNTLTKLSV